MILARAMSKLGARGSQTRAVVRFGAGSSGFAARTRAKTDSLGRRPKGTRPPQTPRIGTLIWPWILADINSHFAYDLNRAYVGLIERVVGTWRKQGAGRMRLCNSLTKT